MVPDRASPNIEALVQEHAAAVYRYAYYLSRDQTEAEDIVQDTFLRATEKLDQLRRPEAARSWLLTIARNGFLKRQGAREYTYLDDNDSLDIVAPEPTNEEIDAEQLSRAVHALPEPFRVALLMYYFEGLSYREIAEQLEMPIGTVMSRLSRAKGLLRANLRPVELGSNHHDKE